MRRRLSETLLELLDGVRPQGEARDLLRVTDVALDLPLEMMMTSGDPEPELLADLPRWRWTTVFDQRPGRLKIRYTLEEP